LIPKSYLDDPELHVKDSGYYYVTDQFVADKVKFVDTFFKIDRKDPAYEARVADKLSALSNLEAKWSLVTLLTRPKSAVTNIFGAAHNTIVSTGTKYFRMAMDYQYLSRINPNWTSKENIETDIDRVGGLESFIKADAGLTTHLRGVRFSKFRDRVLAKLRQDPNTDDATINEIARQEGVFNDIINMGAVFMRKSERLARRQAWLAHYLKAREVFEASNYSYDWDDPWLIEMANRGVHATQFIYNSTNRPMFAKTALGKIFTRFQLWAYNSLNMRAQIVKQASANGYREGTQEFKRFERMALADLFVIGMATFFPMSLFGNSVPTPYYQFVEMSKFLFGDDEEKERAFYGILPYPASVLQMVLPPSSRYLTNMFNLMMTQDIEKFASYHVWSWFPFGAVAYDFKKSVTNPALAAESMLGIPFNTLVRKLQRKPTPNTTGFSGSLESLIGL